MKTGTSTKRIVYHAAKAKQEVVEDVIREKDDKSASFIFFELFSSSFSRLLAERNVEKKKNGMTIMVGRRSTLLLFFDELL
ncbi:hypothetical protein JTE90_012677 [Oedothorax gibbosus]|uniref:Uncharacterized protein n=1 Tax=Oedothorax gibbosus TaxID=931172 RepID=A0AAV6W1K8_9ARAC|nr:hypothetical protein JTE90_012677 [Oedothorax gibbosus]